MTISSFSNSIDNIQSTIRTFISNDSTVKNYTTTIIDGNPSTLTKEVSWPYVLVHTPMIDDTKLTNGTSPLYRSHVTLQIEIVGKKEGNVRNLCDAVRNAIMTNQTTTRGIRIWNPQIGRTRMSIGTLPTMAGQATIYTIAFPVKYDWFGA